MVAMTAQPRVLVPGLMMLGPGVERYRVTGGGATVLALDAGDELEIVDPEGRQRCELIAFDASGLSDPGLLGPVRDAGNGPSPGSTVEPAALDILSAELRDARRVRSGLERAGIDLASVRAATPLRLLDGDTVPGVSARVVAHADIACVVAAPGEAMSAHGGTPVTDLIAYVHRRDPTAASSEPLLPAPLADPSQDFIVKHSTAVAYQVAKGDWFQVVDVEGRQCSDFQCFAVADLEAGADLCLDATITRTLMGATCPAPGLYSKFFNAGCSPRGGDPRHRRPPRHIQHGLQCPLLRRDGLPGPHQLHRQHQRRARPLRRGPPPGLGGHQLLLQHAGGRRQPDLSRPTVVPPGRLCAVAGLGGPGVRVHSVSGRHRRGQRLESHRYRGARLSGHQPVQESDGYPNDCRLRGTAHLRDRIPPPHVRLDPQLQRVLRLLAGRLLHGPRTN